jgi:hypothetical protein
VPTIALRECDCRWPVGDEIGLMQRYCCETVVSGRSYCHEHLHRAHITPVAPRGQLRIQSAVAAGTLAEALAAVTSGIPVYYQPMTVSNKASLRGRR